MVETMKLAIESLSYKFHRASRLTLQNAKETEMSDCISLTKANSIEKSQRFESDRIEFFDEMLGAYGHAHEGLL